MGHLNKCQPFASSLVKLFELFRAETPLCSALITITMCMRLQSLPTTPRENMFVDFCAPKPQINSHKLP